MPCVSDYLEPDERETESARVIKFLYDLGLTSYDRTLSYYGHTDELDKDTARLCQWCKDHPMLVCQQTLELQIWWRDHLNADKARIERAEPYDPGLD